MDSFIPLEDLAWKAQNMTSEGDACGQSNQRAAISRDKEGPQNDFAESG